MKPESGPGPLLAVVDDDDLYREYLSNLFGSQGNWQVIGADSSATMFEILDNNSVDCILLDYNMGAETGLSIGKLIKKKYSDPPPIVMLTGEGKERAAIKAFRGGFSDYVSKQHLKINELIDAIRDAIDRKQCDRASTLFFRGPLT